MQKKTCSIELSRTEFGRLGMEMLDFFVPLSLSTLALREDPEKMKQTVKAVGDTGVADIVTGVDVFVQAQLKKLISEKFPTWQFWGEEGDDNISTLDTSKDYLFITDPIEGTINFANHIDDHWGSVAALVDSKTKQPVVGIVAHPSKSTVYIAVKDAGAYVLSYDDHGVFISSRSLSSEPARENFTYNYSAYFKGELAEKSRKFMSLGTIIEPKEEASDIEKSRKSVEMDREGNEIRFDDLESGALEVVKNRGTIYFKTSNEMAAVFVILEELGGVVTDGKGDGWTLGIDSLIAARNKEDHEYLRDLYRRVAS